MAEQMSSIGGAKAPLDPKIEQAQQQSRTAREDLETKLLSGEDKVSLDQPQEAEQTYGPIPGVTVGTPYELLRALVIKTLEVQGVATQVDTGSEILELQNLAPAEAQELISEDGFFGVEQTSQRIVDFAINAFGKDPARLEEMKAAIEDGFQQAAEVFGGQLPEISHQTYEAIMEKLAAFAESGEQAEKTE